MTTRKKASILCALGAAALLSTFPAAAQDWVGTGRMQGRVQDEAGEPVEGAEVALLADGQEGRGPKPVLTNSRGRWSFLGIKFGQWTVRITKEGKVTSEGTVPLIPSKRDVLQTVLKDVPREQLVDETALAARAQLEQGNELLAAEDYSGARAAYLAALENLDPQYHAMVLMSVSRSHYQEGDTGEAIKTLESILALEPENVDAIKLVADLLVAEGREQEAQEYIARLPEGEKLDPNALANVGIDAYNRGDMDGAMAQFDALITDYPDFSLGFYYRGLIHLAKQENDEATADFNRFLELDPESPKVTEVKDFLSYLSPAAEE